MVPFPPQKLITAYLSPLLPYPAGQNDDFQSPSVYEMCLPTLLEPNLGCIDQISRYKMFTSLSLLFRGENIIPKEIGQKLICDLKNPYDFLLVVHVDFDVELIIKVYVFSMINRILL